MLDFDAIEAKDLELQLLFSALKKNMEEELNKAKSLPGVKQLSDNVCVVSSKSLGNLWSPDYYINKKQVEAILSVLNKTKTVNEFKLAILDMINTGTAGIGKNKLRLNNSLLAVLKEALGTKVTGVS